MIYLLQDSYKDNDGYHDILKIGYSKKSFQESRKNHYDTHNYGYKLLGEREGDIDLESFLHKKHESLRLSNEWFSYSREIVDDFWNISRQTIITKEEYFEYLRKYILNNMIQTVSELEREYLKDLLDELMEVYNSNQTDCNYQEKSFDANFLKKKITDIWKDLQNFEILYWENINGEVYSNLIMSLEMGKLLPSAKVLYSKFSQEIMMNKLFELVNQKIINTNYDLISWDNNKNSSEGKLSIVTTLDLKINVLNYSDSYTTISNVTNEPIEYSLLYLAEKRASEIYAINLLHYNNERTSTPI